MVESHISHGQRPPMGYEHAGSGVAACSGARLVEGLEEGEDVTAGVNDFSTTDVLYQLNFLITFLAPISAGLHWA